MEPSELQAMEAGKETVKATWNHVRIMPEYQVGARLARKRKTSLSSFTNFYIWRRETPGIPAVVAEESSSV